MASLCEQPRLNLTISLYDGITGYRHDQNLWALHISTLWEANA